VTTDLDAHKYLTEICELKAYRILSDGTYLGIKPLVFHWTLIRGDMFDPIGFTERYCMKTEQIARMALTLAEDETKIYGWHKNAITGDTRPLFLAVTELAYKGEDLFRNNEDKLVKYHTIVSIPLLESVVSL